jgi:pimeloyl-ACP methyl ester carboxylesterase
MKDMRVKVGQIELQVREYDRPGETIIFLHFSGANLMMWQRAVPYFLDHYHLLLVDLRGHGKSDASEAGYNIDDMARDVVGIMQELKLERAHVVGSSLGAEVGLSLAANYSEKVISLVCDGALASEYGPYGTWEGSQAEYDEHVRSVLEKMHNRAEANFASVEALVENSRAGLVEIGWWNKDVEAMESYGAVRLAEGGFTSAFRKFAREGYMKHYFHYRLEDYYRRVKCPVLMLPGEEVFENEREKAAMEGLSRLATQARIAAVGGWQHPYGWMLEPKGVCQEILSFLDQSKLGDPFVLLPG